MNDQDDEKKIIDEDKSQSESENQSKVDENNQPEGVDNQKNDPILESNQTTIKKPPNNKHPSLQVKKKMKIMDPRMR